MEYGPDRARSGQDGAERTSADYADYTDAEHGSIETGMSMVGPDRINHEAHKGHEVSIIRF